MSKVLCLILNMKRKRNIRPSFCPNIVLHVSLWLYVSLVVLFFICHLMIGVHFCLSGFSTKILHMSCDPLLCHSNHVCHLVFCGFITDKVKVKYIYSFNYFLKIFLNHILFIWGVCLHDFIMKLCHTTSPRTLTENPSTNKENLPWSCV